MHGNIQWVGISDYDGRRERGGERSRLYRIHMTKFPTCTSPGWWEQRGWSYETIHITQEGNRLADGPHSSKILQGVRIKERKKRGGE